jgi:hypothetical protein
LAQDQGKEKRKLLKQMDDPGFYHEVARLAEKDLEREPESLLPERQALPDRNILKQKLEEVIAYMLDNEFEKLCNAMYRLDVSEKLFHRALNETAKDAVPAVLAELVIERELQKVKTRRLYKDGKL